MKYFGEKSWSSLISKILPVFWVLVLIALIACLLFGAAVLFVPAVQNCITAEMAKPDPANSAKDIKDWQMFMSLPIIVKAIMLPYVAAVGVFLLMIIQNSQKLFLNFRKEIVFEKSNVEVISKIGKQLIVFSILTFSPASLVLSLLLLMLCEIFRNGAMLQEEHDLTV